MLLSIRSVQFTPDGTTLMLDNDDALKRHGVQPTYKKVKGFHPLQLNWGRFFVDAVFRGGKKHSNHGDTADLGNNYKLILTLTI